MASTVVSLGIRSLHILAAALPVEHTTARELALLTGAKNFPRCPPRRWRQRRPSFPPLGEKIAYRRPRLKRLDEAPRSGHDVPEI
jgi:hypothetical protein